METIEIKKVGVVGSGIMGRGIAEVAACAGYSVVMSDINMDIVNSGIKAIDASLSMSVRRQKLSEEGKAQALGRIQSACDLAEFKDCSLVIEAAVENMAIKKDIFRSLDKICPEHTILATNTSCLSIIDIASVTSRMDKVLGLHFFNPVPLMKLLEIVRTISVSEETVETARAFAKSIDKSVVIAPDIPGFIVNRLLLPFVTEAVRLVESGQATKEDIDRAVILGLNHPMGPLKLADMLGLDTACFIADAMYDQMKEDRFAPPVLLRKMVSAGRHGRKTKKGFYDYT